MVGAALCVLMSMVLIQNLEAEQVCAPLTNIECSNAGYNMTARFPNIDGKPYQVAKGGELHTYFGILRGCSDYSETIFCSLYFPKCDPNITRPHLPCRSVCYKFVDECGYYLHLAATHGLLAVLCDLLPDYDGNRTTCFLPKGFNTSTASSGVAKDVCHRIVDQKCTDDMHYNTTFYNETIQNKSNSHVLQSVIASNCSTKLEKFTCFSRFPPCYADKSSIRLPCRSLCKEVSNDCRSAFDKFHIPQPDCDVLYPNGAGVNGICPLSEWPAPWSNGTGFTLPTVIPTTTKPTTKSSLITPTVTKSKNCVPLTIKSCAEAGYSYTFRYPDIKGRPYQEAKASYLDFYVPLLRCSKYTQMIMCSMYAPKCVDDYYPKPVLPCRDVCYQFVKDCGTQIRLASIYGLLVAICDLLPANSSQETPCFEPGGFSSSAEGHSRDVCHPVKKASSCVDELHYNRTFLPPRVQDQSVFNLLETVIRTRCSPNVEKLFCLTRLPPCKQTDDISVHIPCRSLCEEVVSKCKKEFLKRRYPVPDCDFLLPNATGVSGLCEIKSFPVPLRHIQSEPKTTKAPITKKKGNKAGIIAGVVVALVVVIIGVGLAVVYFRWYKIRQPFNPQVFHNVEDESIPNL